MDERAAERVAADVDLQRLRRQVLGPLRADRPASYQRYDWPADALAEWHTIPAGGLVVVEGVYALAPPLGGLYDLALWVECPREVRLARGLARDGEDARARWTQVWMPAEDRYAVLHRPMDRAHVRVDGAGADGQG